MTVVSGVLLDHVHQHPPQGYLVAATLAADEIQRGGRRGDLARPLALLGLPVDVGDVGAADF